MHVAGMPNGNGGLPLHPRAVPPGFVKAEFVQPSTSKPVPCPLHFLFGALQPDQVTAWAPTVSDAAYAAHAGVGLCRADGAGDGAPCPSLEGARAASLSRLTNPSKQACMESCVAYCTLLTMSGSLVAAAHCLPARYHFVNRQRDSVQVDVTFQDAAGAVV